MNIVQRGARQLRSLYHTTKCAGIEICIYASSTHTFMCIFVHMYVRIHTYIYITYIYIHAYTYTYMSVSIYTLHAIIPSQTQGPSHHSCTSHFTACTNASFLMLLSVSRSVQFSTCVRPNRFVASAWIHRIGAFSKAKLH